MKTNPYAPKNPKPGFIIHPQAKDKHSCLMWSEGRADRILGKEQNLVYKKYGAYREGWESVTP